MKDIKKKIISWLMEDGYNELEATESLCFGVVEKIEIIKITYENGKTDYVREVDGQIEKVSL